MAEPNESITKFLSYFQQSMTSSDPWILGVCGGIAEKFSWDPGIVRAIALIFGLMSIELTGIVYLVLWLFFFRN